MLDLLKVTTAVQEMARSRDQFDATRRIKLAQALKAFESAANDANLRDRLDAARTSWLVASPLEDVTPHNITPVETYAVAASDGSQINPSPHEGLEGYLINASTVSIDYNNATYSCDTTPQVFFKLDDLMVGYGGVETPPDGRIVGLRRFIAECDALRAAVETTDVALMDGTLILWWLEADPARLMSLAPTDLKRICLESLEKLFEAGTQASTIIGSYISQPRSSDVIAMLRVIACTEDPVNCDHCPYLNLTKVWTPPHGVQSKTPLSPPKPCDDVSAGTDAHLFAEVLTEGERSPRFRSAASVLGAYAAPIDFVYIRGPKEIGRIEFSAALTAKELDHLCGVVLDQCQKGHGYPVALAEAHHAAIVKAGDRRAFIDMCRRLKALEPDSAKWDGKIRGIA